MKKRKTFLLIDGDSVLFKSFYALFRSLNHFIYNGIHTNGIYEFNIVLNKLLKKYHPDYALVAWDAGSVTFRTKIYPDYKGQRKATPNPLKEQFKPTIEMVKAHGIKNYELKNYEADDIVGTMARKADKAGLHTIIITGDKDYTQLCSKLSTVLLSKRGVTHMQKITPSYLKKTLGLTPEQIIDKKALQGDASDNYPGVEKVGSKTADKLVKKFGSVEGIYQYLANHKNDRKLMRKALTKHLIKDKMVAKLAKTLARINCQSPVKIDLNDCKYQGNHTKQLIKIYQQLGFRKFLSQLNK